MSENPKHFFEFGEFRLDPVERQRTVANRANRAYNQRKGIAEDTSRWKFNFFSNVRCRLFFTARDTCRKADKQAVGKTRFDAQASCDKHFAV